MVAMASGQKFVERSRTVHGRVPIMWQIELTDHVTWCSTPMRTSPAQKNAVSAPHQDQLSSPPSTAGCGQAQRGPAGELAVDPDDVAVGQQVRGETRGVGLLAAGASSPKWECQKPRATAAGLVPNSHGECGSPSLSVKAWWRRWSATQVMTGPWKAMLPTIARPTRSGRRL